MNAWSCFSPVGAGCALVVASACGRNPGAIGPVPASETDAAGAGEIAAGADASPDPRPLGRNPVPIRVDGADSVTRFARLADPTPEHPRGTIATVISHFTRDPDRKENDTFDSVLVEIDLSTGAPLRRLPLGTGAYSATVFDGVHGPIVLSGDRGVTLTWLDENLTVTARRSFRSPPGEPCGADAAGGDRVVFLYCGQRSTTAVIYDPQRPPVQRTCRGQSSVLRTTGLRGDFFVIAGLREGDGDESEDDDTRLSLVCAFRVDGAGGVLSRAFPGGVRLFVHDGEVFAEASPDAAARASLVAERLYRLGPDLRPAEADGEPSPGLPEEVAAAQIRGLSSRLEAHLVNGTIVLQARGCCDPGGPGLYLLDPHADDPVDAGRLADRALDQPHDLP